MNAQEVFGVLAAAALLDPRLGAATDADKVGKAAAWQAALDEDMPADWARMAVARHYGEATTAIMPADLNRLWRLERKARNEVAARERLAREVAERAQQAVPMPDYVKQQIHALREKWTVPSE